VLTVSRNAFTKDCPWAEGEDNHIQMDLSDVAALDATIAELRKRLPEGRLDAMVNNAGISPKLPGGKRMGILETDYEAWIAGTRVHPFAGPAYATSKAALAALTREMAHEFAPHGVRCNAIAPGEIDTSILSPGTDELVRRHIPMQRLGRPEEVAATIYFLCNNPSSYINGAEVHINGGQHV